MVQLDEHLKEKVEVLDEVGGVRLDLMSNDAQKPKHWREEGEGEEGVLNLQHAGVVLVDLGVLWKEGVVDGDEGQDQEVEGEVVNGVQQFENAYVTQGQRHELALLHVLQSVADGNSAVVQGVVLEQVVEEEGVGRQQQQFDGEW